MGISSMEHIGVAIDVTANTQAVPAVVAQVNQATAQIGAMGRSFTVSADQQKAAWARAGGSIAVYNNEITKLVTSQRELIASQTQAAPIIQRVNAAIATQSRNINGAVPGIHRGAGALNTLAFAAAGTGGTLQGAVSAAANLAVGLSAVSGSARVAASASGIGALIVVLGVIISLFQKANEEASAGTGFMARLQNWSLRGAEVQLAALDARIESMTAKAAKDNADFMLRTKDMSQLIKTQSQQELEVLLKDREELSKKVSDIRVREGRQEAEDAARREKQRQDEAERRRNAEAARASDIAHKLGTDVGDLAVKASGADAYGIRRQAATDAYNDEKRQIDELTTLDKERHDQLVALADKRLKMTLEQIRVEKAAAEMKAGLAGYQRLATAAQGYGKIVTAVAKAAADAVRRYEIFVQAKKDWVLAKSQYAAATAAFAAQDYVGGALHLAAAGGYTAAAAAGFAEAGTGGGGGGSSGGGGGSAGGGQSTFEPNSQAGSGSFILQLYTHNPYGADGIAETRFQLGRAGALKKTIPIAPTTGLTAVAV